MWMRKEVTMVSLDIISFAGTVKQYYNIKKRRCESEKIGSAIIGRPILKL